MATLLASDVAQAERSPAAVDAGLTEERIGRLCSQASAALEDRSLTRPGASLLEQLARKFAYREA